jgi:hypothetical protein
MIAQRPTTNSADVSAAVDLLANFFETPTTPSNGNNNIWLSDDDSMPDLATASDSLDEEDKSDGDEVGFKTLLDSKNNDNNMPGLQVVSDSEDEGEDGDKIDNFNDFFSDGGDTDEYEIVGLDNKAYTCTFVADAIKKGTSTSTSLGCELINIELYNSGASHHMSGYRHHFINYCTIPPKPIRAAKKCSFSAIGMGNMYITVPNSDKVPTRVLLKDVLYAPLMGVTLVSISQIAIAGSTLVFQDLTCCIYKKDKTCVGVIEMKNGLYHVFTHHPKTAASAETLAPPPKIMSINKLHQCLGHVAHKAARSLMKKGLVHGVQLDNSKATVCESCEWAKGTRKPIQKV